MDEPGFENWPAPAKLNLFLHVLGRRSDGYHELQTLFQLLDWGDRIAIRLTRDRGITRAHGGYGVPADQDLVIRAARLLQSECGCSDGAVIKVQKAVPTGAGLGGGSSDAATVLLVLNKRWECGLSIDDLAALGARLGADIPVFVRGHSALAGGIGERLEPVELGARFYVLVFPRLSISTAELFSDPSLARESRPLTLADALSGEGRNDFEPVVRRRYPELDGIFRTLTKWGRPALTGTGACIFIPMPDEDRAFSAARQIKTLYNSRAVAGLDRSPLHTMLDIGGE
jgi:4-diphosphocytidyl-2-C-methyl-D-erythritol kinase